jgi:hypothetical protein
LALIKPRQFPFCTSSYHDSYDFRPGCKFIQDAGHEEGRYRIAKQRHRLCVPLINNQEADFFKAQIGRFSNRFYGPSLCRQIPRYFFFAFFLAPFNPLGDYPRLGK